MCQIFHIWYLNKPKKKSNQAQTLKNHVKSRISFQNKGTYQAITKFHFTSQFPQYPNLNTFRMKYVTLSNTFFVPLNLHFNTQYSILKHVKNFWVVEYSFQLCVIEMRLILLFLFSLILKFGGVLIVHPFCPIFLWCLYMFDYSFQLCVIEVRLILLFSVALLCVTYDFGWWIVPSMHESPYFQYCTKESYSAGNVLAQHKYRNSVVVIDKVPRSSFACLLFDSH